MSNHKTPPLNARNWEDLMEADDSDLPTFEKLRHHVAEKDDSDRSKSANKNRQHVHRTRFN